MDLKAFLDTLPAVAGTTPGHALGFPWSVRRGIGAWKRLYLDEAPIVEVDDTDAMLARGRELVEGLGHCGECHTPRGRLGNLLTGKWLTGAPNPEGQGKVPDITPSGKNTGNWSAADIAYYLQSGFTPDFDTVGGTMVAVQENMAQLTDADREAIAAYLMALPATQ
jgi:mono/diheme cytochrome c family protein